MLYLLTLQAIALGQEVAPVVASHPDMWGVGGGGIAGLLSAVLALLVKDKLLSPQQRDGVAPSQANQELQTRVTRLELQTEALRDTQRDLRQLTETLGQLIRDLATKT